MKKNIANCITCTRIIGTVAFLCVPVFSNAFYILYAYCGVSDVLDGFVARHTKTTSKLGSRLDSFSDLLFYVCMMLRMLPSLRQVLPQAIWWYIFAVLALRIVLYAWNGIRNHQFLSNHTILNKATGLLIFGVPFLIRTKIFVPYAILVCAVAFAAALYEAELLRIAQKQKQSEEA